MEFNEELLYVKKSIVHVHVYVVNQSSFIVYSLTWKRV